MEETEELTKEERSKFQSRKFVVWVIWLIISLLIIGFCTVVMIVTKQIIDSMTGLINTTIGYFFAVSMMYLGMNVGQKVGMAVVDTIYSKKDGDK